MERGVDSEGGKWLGRKGKGRKGREEKGLWVVGCGLGVDRWGIVGFGFVCVCVCVCECVCVCREYTRVDDG